MIVLGLTMGMQPIVGYNFGAQKIDRVKQTLKLGIVSGVVITSSGFFICELFPPCSIGHFHRQRSFDRSCRRRASHHGDYVPIRRSTNCYR